MIGVYIIDLKFPTVCDKNVRKLRCRSEIIWTHTVGTCNWRLD